MPLVSPMLGEGDQAIFIDDIDGPLQVNGYQCVKWSEFLERETQNRSVCLAIANSKVRAALAEKCTNNGVSFFSPKAQNTVIMDEVSIGEGAILSPFVTLTSNIQIGRHFHANLYSYVEHDSVIGDFVTFAPGVKCNGNVHIHDHAYIGSGAILKQGTPDQPLVIGAGAVVGMGAVVTKNVPAGATVVGNPARILERN